MIMHSTDLNLFKKAFDLDRLLAVPTESFEAPKSVDGVTHSESEEMDEKWGGIVMLPTRIIMDPKVSIIKCIN